MQKRSNVVVNRVGKVISGAEVTVKTLGGSTATIYSSDGGSPTTNPVPTDSYGRYSYYAADGRYTEEVRKDGVLLATETDILLEDPADGSEALAATTGSGLIGFDYSLTYAAGTIGKWLKDLATSAGSSFIGWIQTGTGAVLRTIQDRLRETVSPGDFSTLQQALNTGKVVRLVDGVTYPITSQLTIPTGGGIIGKGILTFSSTNFTDTTKGITSTSVVLYALSVDNITLRDFKMVGTCAQNSYLYPIALRDVEKADVWGVEITGLNAGSCVLIDSSFDISVKNCNFHDCTLDRTSSGQLTAVESDDFRIGGVGSERINISDNKIKALGWTNAFLTSYGPQTDGVNLKIGGKEITVARNIMDGVGEGVDCFADDCIINSNVIKNALGYGLKLIHGASSNLLKGNRIVDSGLGGIVIAGSSTASKDTDKNTIIGNVISGAGTNPGGYWVQPMYGIGINNDGTYKATNTTVRDNRVISSSGASAAFQGATSGAGNVFIDNESDGTPAAEYSGSTYSIYKRDYLGEFISGVARLFGSTPRLIVSENGAASNEKLWDTAYSSGIMTRRTRTDADGAGETFETVDRTGTTVDLIAWNATTMKFGGVSSANRYATISGSGVLTKRYDDNSAIVVQAMQNYGITASGHGLDVQYEFGTGGALGGTAYRQRILATDTWAAAGNRSVRLIWDAMLAGTLTRVLEANPSTGLSIAASAYNFVTMEGILRNRSYTVATLPSAGIGGHQIYVSDGTSNKRLAVADGTNWRWPDGAIVS